MLRRNSSIGFMSPDVDSPRELVSAPSEPRPVAEVVSPVHALAPVGVGCVWRVHTLVDDGPLGIGG